MQEIIEAVICGCNEVMSTFFPDGPKTVVADELGRTFNAGGRVVTVGMSGEWRGMLLLLFDDKEIATLAEAFLGMPLEDGMEEYADEALIEIGNQIVARAACEIADNNLGTVDITPPSLLCSEKPVSLAWTRMKTTVLDVGSSPRFFRVAVGLSPGPKKFSVK